MSITFSEPYSVAFNTVVMRNPQLGNPRQLNIKTSFKQDMSGTVHSHKQTPSVSKLLLTFTALIEAKKDEFITFYKATIGKLIRYMDQDGKIWKVRFVMNSLTVTTIYDSCNYDLTVEVAGDKMT